MSLTLHHKDKFLGQIIEVNQEGAWMSGNFLPQPNADTYSIFFAYMVDETNTSQNPPFDKELLNPENWFIEENGKRRGIEVPAVYGDGSIEWRWST